jgi:tetratricopeptide (TPR) repeat protein
MYNDDMDETSAAFELLECPICCELFENATETFCGHAFCEYCIARCLENEPEVCPVCRNDPSPIHPSFTLRKIVEEYRKMRGLTIEDLSNKSASEEKQTGNAHYLKGEFADAIKHYSNAIDDTPSAILFGNRATAYFKLNQFRLALQDCEKAIKLDPAYVKAYMRKGLCLEQMRDYNEAYKTFLEVKRLDKSSQLREETDHAIQRITRFVTSASTTSSSTSSASSGAPPPQQQPNYRQPNSVPNAYPYQQQQQQQAYRNSAPYPGAYSQPMYPGAQFTSSPNSGPNTSNANNNNNNANNNNNSSHSNRSNSHGYYPNSTRGRKQNSECVVQQT